MKLCLGTIVVMSLARFACYVPQAPESPPTHWSKIRELTNLKRQNERGADAIRNLIETRRRTPRWVRQWEECLRTPQSVGELELSLRQGLIQKDPKTALRTLVTDLLNGNESPELATRRLTLLLEVSGRRTPQSSSESGWTQHRTDAQELLIENRFSLASRIQRLVEVSRRIDLEVACEFAASESPSIMPVLASGLQKQCPTAVRYFEKFFSQELGKATQILATCLSMDAMQNVLDDALRNSWITVAAIQSERDRQWTEFQRECGGSLDQETMKLVTGLGGGNPANDLTKLSYHSWRADSMKRVVRLKSTLK